MDAPFMFAEEYRVYVSEQLHEIGKQMLEIKDTLRAQPANILMPDWKEKKFNAELCNAAGSILRCMSCLEANEAPTVDALAEELIQRWRKIIDKAHKEKILARLREGFKKETTEGK